MSAYRQTNAWLEAQVQIHRGVLIHDSNKIYKTNFVELHSSVTVNRHTDTLSKQIDQDK